MEAKLVPLLNRLEKAAVHGPGRHELARVFFAYQARNPDERFFVLTDSYGRVWIRDKDFDAAREAVLPTLTPDGAEA